MYHQKVKNFKRGIRKNYWKGCSGRGLIRETMLTYGEEVRVAAFFPN
jgi:hypothetical protein